MSFIGDILFGGAERDAARDQVRASREALTEVRRQADRSNTQQEPFRQFGANFIDQAQGLISGSTNIADDPGVAAELADASRTIDNRAAQAGKFFQPRTVAALNDERANVLRSARSQRVGELLSAVGVGQNTAVNQGAQAINVGGQLAGIQGSIGDARAAGRIGSKNAIGDTIAGVSSFFL